jgi:hypothetical protein
MTTTVFSLLAVWAVGLAVSVVCARRRYTRRVAAARRMHESHQ